MEQPNAAIPGLVDMAIKMLTWVTFAEETLSMGELHDAGIFQL